MDITPVIARIVSDCDLRKQFVRNVPGIFDDYFLLPGEKNIVTKEDLEQAITFNYFLDGIDFVSNWVT